MPTDSVPARSKLPWINLGFLSTAIRAEHESFRFSIMCTDTERTKRIISRKIPEDAYGSHIFPILTNFNFMYC